MTKEQLQQIALNRSEKIFTKEFFTTCTDSWYFDELDYEDPLLIEALRIVTSDMMKLDYHSELEEESRPLVSAIKQALEDF